MTTTMDELERLACWFPCPRCEAPSGHWCVSRTDRRARYLHAARTSPIYDAWGSGYGDGVRDGVERGKRLAERAV